MNPAFSKKIFFGLGLIVLLTVVIFSPAFFTFFSADDFYNMRLVMDQRFTSILSSFLFSRREDFLFYRPLTTQFYFYVLKSLFGLNPLIYHAISFSTFFIILILVYRLAFYLTKHQNSALMTTFFYALTPSNITRLGWIVQIQELIFGLFSFACCLLWIRFLDEKRLLYYLGAIGCFILALMSKESAVVLPFLLFMLFFFRTSFNVQIGYAAKISLPVMIIFVLYMILRLRMGVSMGEHYFTSFSLKSIINTSLWYSLLGLGVPELLLNYKLFAQGVGINPLLINTIVHTMPLVGLAMALCMILFGTLLFYSIRSYFYLSEEQKKLSREVLILALGFFFISLVAHVFSPWHKFAYELTVPMFGLALLLGFLTTLWHWSQEANRKFIMISFLLCFSLYSLLSFATTRVEIQNHWVFRGGTIAHTIFSYFQKYYPSLPDKTGITIVYDGKREDATYGLLKQVPQSLAVTAALQILYNNPDLDVVYRDTVGGESERFSGSEIILSARSFIPELN